jgi:rod shape-determining protein MreB
MPLFSKNLGIDLGTVNVLIYENGQIVLQEPSLVAVATEEDDRGRINVMEIGQPAREMMGRVYEEDIRIERPLQNGVIADYEVAEFMLRYFMNKIAGRMRFFRPRVMMSVPYGANGIERRAVYEAAMTAGAREAFMISEPLAAALGAGLPVATPAGDMIVNIGGGVTEAAVISMNNIVRAASRRVGGLALDEDIIAYVRRKYNLVIGQPTAEAIKIQIGAAIDQPDEMTMEIQGRDNVSGLPRTVTMTTGEVVEALQEVLNNILGVIKEVLSNTPPELASDIIDRGITLTGGSALLRGLDDYITKYTGVPAYRAENPLIAVAVGAGRALEDQAILKRLSLTHF